MLRKNAWIGLLLLVVFLPSTLLAQEMMHGKWWQNKKIAEELNLSDSEKQILDKKYTESRRNLIDLKSAVEKERFELGLLLDTQDMDKAKVIERYDSLEKARTSLAKERFGLLMEVRETLGVERYQELKAMHRNREKKDIKRHYKDRSYRD